MSRLDLEIIAEFGGRRIERPEILRWENRRIDAAAKKLGVAAPKGGNIEARREALLEAKRSLGNDEISRRLEREVRWADRIARLQAGMSTKRRCSVTELYASRGSARAFASWFEHITASNQELDMVRACPDHFVLRTFADGSQEVLETTGSSPLAARFVIDYQDVSTLVTPIDAMFSRRIDGVARASDGSPIGGVRHQFRDIERGFHARLAVEFPLLTPPQMISGHRWHLACEFSNWIESALAAD